MSLHLHDCYALYNGCTAVVDAVKHRLCNGQYVGSSFSAKEADGDDGFSSSRTFNCIMATTLRFYSCCMVVQYTASDALPLESWSPKRSKIAVLPIARDAVTLRAGTMWQLHP